MKKLLIFNITATIVVALAFGGLTYLNANGPSTFNCPGPGRYPNPQSDPPYESYYFCISDSSGKLLAKLIECPGGTLFHPEKRVCTTAFIRDHYDVRIYCSACRKRVDVCSQDHDMSDVCFAQECPAH